MLRHSLKLIAELVQVGQYILPWLPRLTLQEALKAYEVVSKFSFCLIIRQCIDVNTRYIFWMMEPTFAFKSVRAHPRA
jgi:hypothetical protein